MDDLERKILENPLRRLCSCLYGDSSLFPPTKPVYACVYAFKMSDNTVKIGVTRNVQNRILSVEASVYIKVVDTHHTNFAPFNFMRSIERACHKAFEEKRVRGEYFDVPFEEACAELDRHANEIVAEHEKAEATFLAELECFKKLEQKYSAEKSRRSAIETIHERSRQTIETLENIRKTKEILENDLGVPTIKALSTAIDIAEAINNIDLAPLRKLIFFSEYNNDYFTAEQIGRKLNFDTETVNKHLQQNGFQYEDGADWRLTEKGNAYGVETKSVNEESWSTSYEIRWSKNIIKILTNAA